MRTRSRTAASAAASAPIHSNILVLLCCFVASASQYPSVGTPPLPAAAVVAAFQLAPLPFPAYNHRARQQRRRGRNPFGIAAASDDGEQQNDGQAQSQPAIAVKSSELDASLDLDEEERTVVNVFRKCGPSVAYVGSVVNRRSPSSSSSDVVLGDGDEDRNGRVRRSWRSRRRSSNRRRRNDKEDDTFDDSKPPPGTSLGSGSGFLVSPDGYLVTNYHVVQRAYQMNEAVRKYNDNVDGWIANATRFVQPKRSGSNVENNPFWDALSNRTKAALRIDGYDDIPPATTFVRINSGSKYQRCRIVDVCPELDVAVLKVIRSKDASAAATDDYDDSTSYPALQYGSSSDLLVGQRLVAIGNPFGLDQTVTSGVVSALNRQVTGVAGNAIMGCVQTDASINPGNSGGPLLDSKGRLVGVNTMIVTTSGSSAGIGFAIPGDAVRRATQEIIRKDRALHGVDGEMGTGRKRAAPGWLGVELAADELASALRKTVAIRRGLTTTEEEADSQRDSGAYVVSVKRGSPAEEAGLRPLRLDPDGGGAVVGDQIVAVNGRTVAGRSELERDVASRVEGEQISLTVEDADGERRVMYLTLGKKEY